RWSALRERRHQWAASPTNSAASNHAALLSPPCRERDPIVPTPRRNHNPPEANESYHAGGTTGCRSPHCNPVVSRSKDDMRRTSTGTEAADPADLAAGPADDRQV